MIQTASKATARQPQLATTLVDDDRWWERVRPFAESLIQRHVSEGIDELPLRELELDAGDCQAYAVPVRPGPREQPMLIVAVIPGEDRPLPSADVLRRRFRLTRREAQVALLLAERRTNREIARELGVSRHTAERHTERVLCKLGIHRRTEVERVVRSAGPAERRRSTA